MAIYQSVDWSLFLQSINVGEGWSTGTISSPYESTVHGPDIGASLPSFMGLQRDVNATNMIRRAMLLHDIRLVTCIVVTHPSTLYTSNTGSIFFRVLVPNGVILFLSGLRHGKIDECPVFSYTFMTKVRGP
ncbi:hypothetical protein PTI98_000169 [Pleurotus ostreatus]|nr:hypothetical protein PTI98_000169 [Pleurotus ostreatus]